MYIISWRSAEYAYALRERERERAREREIARAALLYL